MRTLIVAGLGRCGSSLVMQMLHTAGVDTAGEWPAFEGDIANRFTFGEVTADDWRSLQGRAVKALFTGQRPVPSGALAGVDVLWLSRDKKEQARSQAKFASLMRNLPVPNRPRMRRWVKSIEFEDGLGRNCWRISGARVRVLNYEDILSHPKGTALHIAQFGGFGFDDRTINDMAACVRKGDPTCAKDLAMEISLVQTKAPMRGDIRL